MLFEPTHASNRLLSSYKDIYVMAADDMGIPTEHPWDTFKYSVSYDKRKKTTVFVIIDCASGDKHIQLLRERPII